MTGERVGAGDLVEWLTDVGHSTRQVGALLVLGGSDIDATDVERLLVQRFGKLRQFGQRLEQSGRGRPRWVDAGAQSVAGAALPASGTSPHRPAVEPDAASAG